MPRHTLLRRKLCQNAFPQLVMGKLPTAVFQPQHRRLSTTAQPRLQRQRPVHSVGKLRHQGQIKLPPQHRHPRQQPLRLLWNPRQTSPDNRLNALREQPGRQRNLGNSTQTAGLFGQSPHHLHQEKSIALRLPLQQRLHFQ
ncbi:MAG: hypothetical protein KDE56_07860, partial [Anaerolineales bacterium]|nr:hypothetical protein [Anaerolineales bacterium]